MGARRGRPARSWALPARSRATSARRCRRRPLEFGPAGPAPAAAARVPALHATRPAGRSPRRRSTRTGDPIARAGARTARSARITPHGGGAAASGREPGRGRPSRQLVGARAARPGRPLPRRCRAAAARATLARRRGARRRTRGAGRVAVAAYEDGGDAARAVRRARAAREDAVLHYDDGARTWTREPIDVAGAGSTRSRSSRSTPRRRATPGCSARDAGRARSALFAARRRPRWEPRAARRCRPRGVDAARRPRADAADRHAPTASGSTARSAPAATDATLLPRTPTAARHRRGATTRRATTRSARASRAAQGYRSIGFAGGGVGARDLQPAPAGRRRRGQPRHLPACCAATTFVRMPGGGGSFRPQRGVQLARRRLARRPGAGRRRRRARRACARGRRPLRAPLTAAVAAPGQPRRARSTRAALAVGQDGAVAALRARRAAGRASSCSPRAAPCRKPLLRGVAWPEPGRAHAVGDLGAMWLWRAETGLWERDPAAPVGFEGNLMGVAFEPGDPQRGYAVGKEGVAAALRQDVDAGAAARRASRGATSPRSRSRARRRSSPPARDLLVNDGGGWRVDARRARAARDAAGRRAAARRRRRAARRRRGRRRRATS